MVPACHGQEEVRPQSAEGLEVHGRVKGHSDINFLSLNGADNGLHLVSAVAGLAIALWPAHRTARADVANRRS